MDERNKITASSEKVLLINFKNKVNPIAVVDSLTLKSEDKIILKDISFKTHRGEAWAIIGKSGSGKTLLGKILSGHLSGTSGIVNFNLPSDSKRIMISQQHDFRDAAERSYYQQRFDSNYGNIFPVVEDELRNVFKVLQGVKEEEFLSDLQRISELLKISHLLKSRLIELSNGEGKRLQLARALLQKPDLIVFDNPFLGLDTEARKILHEVINELIRSGIIIFIITTEDEIPKSVTHILELEDGSVKQVYLKSEFNKSSRTQSSVAKLNYNIDQLKELYPPSECDFKVAVEMKNVSVAYGEKKILEGINWKVKKGEKWALLGPNGSGKSTLLSLINGDNPQGYGNDLWIFDKKKGSGESIWEIKKKIGYISPELHIFFQRNLSSTEALTFSTSNAGLSSYAQPGTNAYETIASGFNDQIGSSQKITTLQKRQVEFWLELLSLEELRNTPLYKIPLGKQRLALLGRALVKNPPLLILDEPCQGLDKEQTAYFVQIADQICTAFDKTLIYVSHYKEDIPSCVNKFLFLEKGKVKSSS